MAHVVERAGQRLLDAVGDRSRACGPCAARAISADLNSSPCVSMIVVVSARARSRAPEARRSSRQVDGLTQRAAPAPRRDRDHLRDRRMQPRPAARTPPPPPRRNARIGPPRARLGQRRHVMDHIAERRGLDEKHVGHRSITIFEFSDVHIPGIKHTGHLSGDDGAGNNRPYTAPRYGFCPNKGQSHDRSGHRRRRLYRQPHGARAGRRRRARRRARQSVHRLRHRLCRSRCCRSSATSATRRWSPS